MKNFKKISHCLFFSFYLLLSFSLITPALAESTSNIEFSPQISIPGTEFQQGTGVAVGEESGGIVRSDLLARYVSAAYTWGLSILGVIAVLMLMAGGIIWTTSFGDSGKIEQAKKMISGSLLGSFILVGAYFLLNTINPNLTNLPVIEMTVIKKINIGCCEKLKGETKGDMTISSNCETGYFYEDKILNYSTGKCEEAICCIKEKTTTNTTIDKTFERISCFDTSKTKCNRLKADQADNSKYSYVNSSCSEYSKCSNSAQGSNWCNNKKNGERVLDGYCYNQKIYPIKGTLGEPCGEKSSNGYGICIKNSLTCKDKNNIGGRSCDGEPDLKCCLDEGIKISW